MRITVYIKGNSQKALIAETKTEAGSIELFLLFLLGGDPEFPQRDSGQQGTTTTNGVGQVQ